MNWLEHYKTLNFTQAIDCIRSALRKKLRLSKNGQFAVLQVGDVKKVILRNSNLPCRIVRKQQKGDPSHCGIFGYDAYDDAIPEELAELVQSKDMFPGEIQ